MAIVYISNHLPSQVALRFVTQSGVSFATQSQNPLHFKQDLSIFDFELSVTDMATLEALNVQPAWEGASTVG